MKKVHKYCIEEDGVIKVCLSIEVWGAPATALVGIGTDPKNIDRLEAWGWENFRKSTQKDSFGGAPVELMEADEYIRQEMEDMEEPEEVPTP